MALAGERHHALGEVDADGSAPRAAAAAASVPGPHAASRSRVPARTPAASSSGSIACAVTAPMTSSYVPVRWDRLGASKPPLKSGLRGGRDAPSPCGYPEGRAPVPPQIIPAHANPPQSCVRPAGRWARRSPPAVASADSIVYVKDANVWLADGAGGSPVPGDHGRHRRAPLPLPSQADDGTIAASYGDEILRMRQNGEALNRLDPPTLTNSVSHPQDGVPVDVAISPDGTRVAYSFYGYECPVGASCGARTTTGVSPRTASPPRRRRPATSATPRG